MLSLACKRLSRTMAVIVQPPCKQASVGFLITSPISRNVFTGPTTYTQCESKPGSFYEWNQAFSAAEKIVGYPTSFLSLRWLLSDEISNVAVHLRKLVGSNHPLLKTAKNLLYNGKNNMQAWGLIVLLLSKTAGQSANISPMETISSGVLSSQRALAEVTEMIRISHLVHQGLINLQPLAQAGQDMSLHGEMTFGNKIALLSGDYLLGNSCAELAKLRNQQLVELISSAVRDLAEAEFIGDRDEQNNPLPSKPQPQQSTIYAEIAAEKAYLDNLKPIDKTSVMGHPEAEWEMRHLLSSASLLGKSCQGAMILAGHSNAVQRSGYEFGRHLALAWQARLDVEPFLTDNIAVGTTFSLVSAPVIYNLEHAPHCYANIQKGCITVENVDFVTLHREIRAGPAVQATRKLQRKHTLRAMKCLNTFAPSDARTALQNIILSM